MPAITALAAPHFYGIKNKKSGVSNYAFISDEGDITRVETGLEASEFARAGCMGKKISNNQRSPAGGNHEAKSRKGKRESYLGTVRRGIRLEWGF